MTITTMLGAVELGGLPRLAVYDEKQGCFRPVSRDVLRVFPEPRDFYTSTPHSLKLLDTLRESLEDQCVSLEKPLPPPYRPPNLWGVGRSFRAHAEEMGMEARIAFFVKSTYSIVGHRHPILVPPGYSKADYEGEMAVIVGRRLRSASPREAGEAIVGYTAVNDVTERRLQDEMSWSIAKSLDTFGPLGPAVALVEGPGDLEGLCVETLLNGERVQRGCVSDMVASIPEILSRLSSIVTLRPGDIVMLGTPPGVGHARSPPRYLKPGDVVEVRVSGLPGLVNPVASG